jgi:hypothetical protein
MIDHRRAIPYNLIIIVAGAACVVAAPVRKVNRLPAVTALRIAARQAPAAKHVKSILGNNLGHFVYVRTAVSTHECA